MRRLVGFDLLRGAGIMGVIVVHSAVFSYGGIDSVDFEHPPPLVAVMGILTLFGGLFTLISGAVNTLRAGERVSREGLAARNTARNLTLSGLFLLALHYPYNLFLGPTSFDFTTHRHHYALVPALLRFGWSAKLDMKRLFEGSTFSLLGWNLILTGMVLYLLLRGDGRRRKRRNYAVLGALGTALLLTGPLRISLYPWCARALEEKRYLLALLLGFAVDKPFPLMPYLAFGMFGALLGLALANGEPASTVRMRFGALGALWLVIGLGGILLAPPVVGRVDLSWFFKVQMELGLFLLGAAAFLSLSRFASWEERGGGKASSLLRIFGTRSLTIFLLQTPLSEALARGLAAMRPGWNMDMGRMLLFGGANLLLWIALVEAWRMMRLPWPAEELRSWYYRRTGRESTGGA